MKRYRASFMAYLLRLSLSLSFFCSVFVSLYSIRAAGALLWKSPERPFSSTLILFYYGEGEGFLSPWGHWPKGWGK